MSHLCIVTLLDTFGEGIAKWWKDYKSDFAQGVEILTNTDKRNEAIDLISNYGDGSIGEGIVKGVLGVPNDIKNSDKNYAEFNKTFNIDNKAVRVTEGVLNGFAKFGVGFVKGTAFLGKTAFDGGTAISATLANKLGRPDDSLSSSYKNNFMNDINTWKQVPGGIWNSGVNVVKTTPRLFTDPNISEEDVSNLTSNAIGTAFVLKGSHDLIQNGGNNLINGLSNMENMYNNGGLQLATADGFVGGGSNAAIMTSPIVPSLGEIGWA
ncbi:MAG: hypothetical protein H7Y18_17355 [Clostridiaceae bacterium]|nr:hypothetical protein [Clostridiaceae bacterium]